jgi:diguanylate cyclase (GGDEF)-like protein
MLNAMLVNGFALLIHGLLFLFCAVSFIRMAVNRQRVRLPQFFPVAFFVLLWSVTAVLRYIIAVEWAVYFSSFLPYVFSIFALIALFRFMMVFYNMNIFCKTHVLAAACVFPLSVLASVIFSYIGFLNGTAWGNLMRIDPEISFEPYNAVLGANGTWQQIAFTFSIIAAAGLFAAALSRHFKLPKIYRPASERMLTGTVLVLTGYLLSMFNSNAATPFFDVFALGFFVIALRLFFNSTLESQGLVFLAQARNEILQHLEQCIFILDGDKNIVFCNEKAEEMLGLHIGDSYPGLLERLGKDSKKFVKLTDEESGHDYYFDIEDEQHVYNLREKPIFDTKERQIGAYVIYSDVTQNRGLIRRLEEGAGRDALTGLHNRSMMEKLKKELDKPFCLPLGIIICDLNNLKLVNDVHGHQAGDIMLRVCGSALSDKSPPTAQAGRIGGDEFMIILPQTAQLEAESLMNDIREYLKGADYPFEITMAMGCRIKEREDQELSALMLEADKDMYADKKRIKGGAALRSTETELF